MNEARELPMTPIRKQRLADLKKGGALILERNSFWWEIEFERGGEVCIHVIEADVDSVSYQEDDFVYYPASRTLMLINDNGVHRVITGIITLRQDWCAQKKENWDSEIGYVGSRYVHDNREKMSAIAST